MTTKLRHEKAPRPATQEHDEEGLAYAEDCIRIMERFFAAVDANPETERHSMTLLDMYMDVLQHELAPFAFELAYELFAENDPVVRRRRADR